jgi:hypothetical protein
MTATLGLNRDQLLQRHARETLAQIATAQHVTTTTLMANLRYTVSALTFAASAPHAISSSEALATQQRYQRLLTRLLTARAGSDITPLLDPLGLIVRLPRGTRF